MGEPRFLAEFLMVSDFINFFPYLQHFLIEAADHGGALLKLLINELGFLPSPFVPELMIKAGPVIH